jgi:protein-S-isoprenylcysteine O-methyltransferase Ste14
LRDPQPEPVPMWRHLLAIALLPGTVLGVVPAYLLWRSGTIAPGGALPPLLALGSAALGALLAAAGLFLMAHAIGLFRSTGRGTLAPWDPTGRLVVQGIYRHVRNPMITGVLCVLLGEAAFFASARLLSWFALFAVINAVYIPLLEEPLLVRRFGADYERYRAAVPRWLPRRTPWRP